MMSINIKLKQTLIAKLVEAGETTTRAAELAHTTFDSPTTTVAECDKILSTLEEVEKRLGITDLLSWIESRKWVTIMAMENNLDHEHI